MQNVKGKKNQSISKGDKFLTLIIQCSINRNDTIREMKIKLVINSDCWRLRHDGDKPVGMPVSGSTRDDDERMVLYLDYCGGYTNLHM